MFCGVWLGPLVLFGPGFCFGLKVQTLPFLRHQLQSRPKACPSHLTWFSFMGGEREMTVSRSTDGSAGAVGLWVDTLGSEQVWSIK